MAKINATYSSGYYISPDTDFRKLEEQQQREQKDQRKRTRDGTEVEEAKRQTFAIPFDLKCLRCHNRIVRGSHVYTNRRATDQKYLGQIRIWELEIRCKFCQKLFYLRTDPETPKETGGYVCARECERCEGDYLALNKANKAVREQWAKEKEQAELNPLEALERENEAARLLAERNRQIEEAVEVNAELDDTALLKMLRDRNKATTPTAGASALASTRHASLASALASSSSSAADGDVRVTEEENEEYLRFEREMTLRWQQQQRQQEQEDGGNTSSHDCGTGSVVGGGVGLMEEAATHVDAVAALAQRYYSGTGGSSGNAEVVKKATKPRNAFVMDEDEDEDDFVPEQRQGVRPAVPVAQTTSVYRDAASTRKNIGSLLASIGDDDDDDEDE